MMRGTTGVLRYVYRRGVGADRRVMHLAGYDRLGRFSGPLCDSDEDLDTSCNLPLGQPVCPHCREAEAALERSVASPAA